MIFAKTQNQAKIAVNKFGGETSKYLRDINKKLLNVIATIETNIDYPEYDDVKQLTQHKLLPELLNLKEELTHTVKTSEDSRFISEGIRVAIVGKPNSGKSTLLNALIHEDKAIVTNIPGTTRDIVEGELVIKGALLKLVDTAGIHSTKDEVEKEGIKKSLEQISKADLVIHLIDSDKKETEDDSKIALASKNKLYIKVFNKSDIKKHEGISISAKNNDLDQLIVEIKNNIPSINLNESKMVTNSRQLSLIKQAEINISSSIEGLNSGFQPDEVIVDIRAA